MTCGWPWTSSSLWAGLWFLDPEWPTSLYAPWSRLRQRPLHRSECPPRVGSMLAYCDLKTSSRMTKAWTKKPFIAPWLWFSGWRLCDHVRNFLSASPPLPGRDLVRVRSPGTPLASLSPPLRLVLSTAFMCSCSSASSVWPRPWERSPSWLPLGALLLMLEPYRAHWWGETEWKRIRIWQLVFEVFLGFDSNMPKLKHQGNIQPVKIMMPTLLHWLIHSDVKISEKENFEVK